MFFISLFTPYWRRTRVRQVKGWMNVIITTYRLPFTLHPLPILTTPPSISGTNFTQRQVTLHTGRFDESWNVLYS